LIATVQRLVEFYVTEHNERIPHGAFEGQTPDEMYFALRSPDDLALHSGGTRLRAIRLRFGSGRRAPRR